MPAQSLEALLAASEKGSPEGAAFGNLLNKLPAMGGYFGAGDYISRMADQNRVRGKIAASDEERAIMTDLIKQAGGDPEKAIKALIGISSPEAIEMATKMKGLAPKPAEPYSLPPEHVRFGTDNRPVAVGLPKSDSDRPQQMRTIFRGSLSIQQERKPDGTWVDVGSGQRFNPVTGEAPSITGDTLEMDAWRYLTDGTLPPNMGRGTQGAQQAAKIRNRSSGLAKEMGMDPSEIRFGHLTNKAAVTAISQLGRARAQILQFEKTAMANADIALEQSNKVDRTGVPLINKYLLAPVKTQLMNDPEFLKLHNATETFISEYARVMGGGYGAAQTTEGAQQRAHTLLNAAHTKEQFEALIGKNGLLRREMRNREKALNDQMEEEKRRLRGGLPQRPGTTAPAAPSGEWSIRPL